MIIPLYITEESFAGYKLANICVTEIFAPQWTYDGSNFAAHACMVKIGFNYVLWIKRDFLWTSHPVKICSYSTEIFSQCYILVYKN